MARIATVTDFIETKDFDTVWSFLETKFGYSKQWRIDWQQYVDDQASLHPTRHAVLDFVTFGVRHVDPLLNAALCRNQYYATFSRMVFWLVRDRLEGVGWISFSETEPF